jgi:hypothetical protein
MALKSVDVESEERVGWRGSFRGVPLTATIELRMIGQCRGIDFSVTYQPLIF